LISALDGVSGQRHAPAALYSKGKDRRYPLDRKLGGLKAGLDKKALPEIEPRWPGRPVPSQTLYWL